MYTLIYNLLYNIRFCDCHKKENQLYDSYCSRVAETLCNKIEEIIKKGEK